MGPTGADDFPKRAVVSDCEPLKLKGRLKEGAAAQTQLRGSAVALCAEDGFLRGRGGVGLGSAARSWRSQEWFPPVARAPVAWTAMDAAPPGDRAMVAVGEPSKCPGSRPGPRLPGGRPGAGRMTLSEVCFGDRYRQRDSAPRQPSQMACWVGWTNTHTQSNVKNEYVNE